MECRRWAVGAGACPGTNLPITTRSNFQTSRYTTHYAVGVLPARPKKPRDKASVEAGVRFAQTYILGRLRNHSFFSLEEANAAIRIVMAQMNTRLMRKIGVSRADLLESLERPALKPLPDAEYEYAEWKLVRVGIDYHVEVEDFYYSVPHALIRQQVDARITSATIELFHKGKRVAAHQRRYGGARRHGTLPDHMPPKTCFPAASKSVAFASMIGV